MIAKTVKGPAADAARSSLAGKTATPFTHEVPKSECTRMRSVRKERLQTKLNETSCFELLDSMRPYSIIVCGANASCIFIDFFWNFCKFSSRTASSNERDIR